MISKEAKDPEVKYLGKKSLSKDSEVKMGGHNRTEKAWFLFENDFKVIWF